MYLTVSYILSGEDMVPKPKSQRQTGKGGGATESDERGPENLSATHDTFSGLANNSCHALTFCSVPE